MKNFFKKLNKGQDVEQDDLNLDYGDFYSGKDSRDTERVDNQRRDDRATAHSAGGYYDVPKSPRGGYEEPDFQNENTRYYDAESPVERPAERLAERVVERPVERLAERPVNPRETWQESDAPGYRAAEAEAAPAAPAVFTPAPAPEYLYFTPSTYRDCREGIVKGMATGHVVVVRLRNLEAGDVLRLFDYMMGAVLALEGELVRPAATTVVLIPKDVELDEDELEPDDEDEDEYEDEDEDEYDDEDGEYVEDTYENGEYGSYDEDEEYEEDPEEEYEEDYEDDSEEEYEEDYEEDYEAEEDDGYDEEAARAHV